MKSKEIIKVLVAVYLFLLTAGLLYIMSDVFINHETYISNIETLNVASLEKANEGLDDRLYEDLRLPIVTDSFQYGDSDPFR